LTAFIDGKALRVLRGTAKWNIPVFSGVRLLSVRHVEPFTLLFQNLGHRAAFYAPLICDVLLPDPRVLLVVEADFLTLVIEKPLFAWLADEFLEGFS